MAPVLAARRAARGVGGGPGAAAWSQLTSRAPTARAQNKCGGYGNHACPGAAAKAAPKPPPPVKPKAAKAPKRKPGRAGKAGKAASAKYSAPPMSEVDVTKSVRQGAI